MTTTLTTTDDASSTDDASQDTKTIAEYDEYVARVQSVAMKTFDMVGKEDGWSEKTPCGRRIKLCNGEIVRWEKDGESFPVAGVTILARKKKAIKKKAILSIRNGQLVRRQGDDEIVVQSISNKVLKEELAILIRTTTHANVAVMAKSLLAEINKE